MSEPTYLLWTPRIGTAGGGSGVVRLNVTPLAAGDWPSAGEAFYAQILRDLGLDTKATAWEVLPYRTRYHGDPTASDWRDRWKRNWRVTIRCAGAPAEAPALEEGYETEAFDTAIPVPDGDPMHAMVLADFPDPASAAGARRALEERREGAERIETVDVEGSFWQLQIDLGGRSPSFFEDSAEVADAVEEICHERGGWTTFDERIRVLG